ncbi:trk system potassium uptake protein TrkH [Methanococcus voltae]|uniref:TrkH family potassium uptake protein n=1 Tax=Methanococcus voltae TaxID=2188 RepID=UPI001AE309F5|nr:TrkH family potassium uptake protein [Methanococcus voltae]MBP2144376.1 trk system potassium uptake protein TrkH [Methanococcus voltae]
MKIFKKRDAAGIMHELGLLMMSIGSLMIVPGIFAVYYSENWSIFVVPALAFILLGYLVNRFTKSIPIKLKHAMVISALAWLMASMMGAVPLTLSIDYFGYIDGVFESMSAWTTTGFSIISDVESLPRSVQLWRSLQQWVGGVGVLVMVISILSKAGASAYYRAEAREEKILPSTLGTVKKIWHIYILYTVLGICMLYISGLNLWDAINICMCGISTGGMSVSNSSFPYGDVAKLIMIAIMYIGGVVSFSVHHNLLTGKDVHDIQTKASIPILAISALVLVLSSGISPIDALFTMVSAMTSTGFSTVSMAGLSNISLAVVIFVMVIGGATGTTTGGIKLMRFLIMGKAFYYKLKESVLPAGSVVYKKIGKNIMSGNLITDAFIIGFGYVVHYIMASLMLIFLGYDPYKSLFEAVSMVANMGLSVNIVSSAMHPLAKLTGIISMWVGRLEIIPVYVLLILPAYLKLKDMGNNSKNEIICQKNRK